MILRRRCDLSTTRQTEEYPFSVIFLYMQFGIITILVNWEEVKILYMYDGSFWNGLSDGWFWSWASGSIMWSCSLIICTNSRLYLIWFILIIRMNISARFIFSGSINSSFRNLLFDPTHADQIRFLQPVIFVHAVFVITSMHGSILNGEKNRI